MLLPFGRGYHCITVIAYKFALVGAVFLNFSQVVTLVLFVVFLVVHLFYGRRHLIDGKDKRRQVELAVVREVRNDAFVVTAGPESTTDVLIQHGTQPYRGLTLDFTAESSHPLDDHGVHVTGFAAPALPAAAILTLCDIRGYHYI